MILFDWRLGEAEEGLDRSRRDKNQRREEEDEKRKEYDMRFASISNKNPNNQISIKENAKPFEFSWVSTERRVNRLNEM